MIFIIQLRNPHWSVTLRLECRLLSIILTCLCILDFFPVFLTAKVFADVILRSPPTKKFVAHNAFNPYWATTFLAMKFKPLRQLLYIVGVHIFLLLNFPLLVSDLDCSRNAFFGPFQVPILIFFTVPVFVLFYRVVLNQTGCISVEDNSHGINVDVLIRIGNGWDEP